MWVKGRGHEEISLERLLYAIFSVIFQSILVKISWYIEGDSPIVPSIFLVSRYHSDTNKNVCSLQKSCYDSAHICPIRAEISTHEHWENVFILLFVWLVVMGFRQNYFHISPNFGDFGAKMSFFRYIINQKRKIFIKHCSPPPPPVFQNTTYIRDVYLYNKQSV